MTWLVVTVLIVVFLALTVAVYYVYLARPSAPRTFAANAAEQRPPPAASPGAVRSTNAARWGAGLVVVGAVGAFLLLQPDSSDSEISYAEHREAIAAVDDANNESTEGAPQQAVVNGWTTIDQLELLSVQQEESEIRRGQSDRRRDALLLLLVVGVALLVAKSEHNQFTRSRSPSD